MFVYPQYRIRLLVYIDNIIAAAKKQKKINWFYKKLSRQFNTKNLEEIYKILDIQVTCNRKSKSIYLDQEQYLRTILEKFGLKVKTNKNKKIPIADYKQLRPATDNNTRINITKYQQGIRSLIYTMVLTCPDIAFVLG